MKIKRVSKIWEVSIEDQIIRFSEECENLKFDEAVKKWIEIVNIAIKWSRIYNKFEERFYNDMDIKEMVVYRLQNGKFWKLWELIKDWFSDIILVKNTDNTVKKDN